MPCEIIVDYRETTGRFSFNALATKGLIFITSLDSDIVRFIRSICYTSNLLTENITGSELLGKTRA